VPAPMIPLALPERMVVLMTDSMECCGKSHTTRFCPDCGNQLSTDVYSQILCYFESQLSARKTATRRKALTLERSSDHKELYRKRLVNAQKNEQKWQSWRDYLVAKGAGTDN